MTRATRKRITRWFFQALRDSFGDTLDLRFEMLEQERAMERLERELAWEKKQHQKLWKAIHKERQGWEETGRTILMLRHRISEVSRALEASHKPKLP